jgi:hypothetical protein
VKVIVPNIPVDRMAGWLEGNIGMYIEGGGSTAAQGVDPWDFFLQPPYGIFHFD